jgi:hypothetical protein
LLEEPSLVINSNQTTIEALNLMVKKNVVKAPVAIVNKKVSHLPEKFLAICARKKVSHFGKNAGKIMSHFPVEIGITIT